MVSKTGPSKRKLESIDWFEIRPTIDVHPDVFPIVL